MDSYDRTLTAGYIMLSNKAAAVSTYIKESYNDDLGQTIINASVKEVCYGIRTKLS